MSLGHKQMIDALLANGKIEEAIAYNEREREREERELEREHEIEKLNKQIELEKIISGKDIMTGKKFQPVQRYLWKNPHNYQS